VNKKVLACLKHGFAPLICLGETLLEKEHDAGTETVARQVRIALHGVGEREIGKVIIAYEPVWAIGETGLPADPAYVGHIHGCIRGKLREKYGERAEHVPILYGGSVNKQNSLEYMQQKNVDGLFIGRSAWDADNFYRIITAVKDDKKME
jgi:triosephosphate isomerase